MTDPKPCRHDLLSCFECEPSTIDDPLPAAPEPQERRKDKRVNTGEIIARGHIRATEGSE